LISRAEKEGGGDARGVSPAGFGAENGIFPPGVRQRRQPARGMLGGGRRYLRGLELF